MGVSRLNKSGLKKLLADHKKGIRVTKDDITAYTDDDTLLDMLDELEPYDDALKFTEIRNHMKLLSLPNSIQTFILKQRDRSFKKSKSRSFKKSKRRSSSLKKTKKSKTILQLQDILFRLKIRAGLVTGRGNDPPTAYNIRSRKELLEYIKDYEDEIEEASESRFYKEPSEAEINQNMKEWI